MIEKCIYFISSIQKWKSSQDYKYSHKFQVFILVTFDFGLELKETLVLKKNIK